jgi:hypothetical protein
MIRGIQFVLYIVDVALTSQTCQFLKDAEIVALCRENGIVTFITDK